MHDHARALVSGHSAYTPTSASSQRRDGTAQYQALLTRTRGIRLVTAVRATSNDRG